MRLTDRWTDRQTDKGDSNSMFYGWWSGVVVSALASINEVNLCRARLVPGTEMGDHVWVQFSVPDTHLGM